MRTLTFNDAVSPWHDHAEEPAALPCTSSEREPIYMLPQLVSPYECQTRPFIPDGLARLRAWFAGVFAQR